MKLFFVALLCALATAAFAQYDYALFEDADLLGNIRQKVREGLDKALDRIKALIEKFRPLAENFKAKISDLKEKIRELATKTGEKLQEAVKQVREKVRQLLREVIAKITKKEDEAVSYSEIDEQTPLEKFGQFLKERIQSAITRIREFIDTHKDTVTQAVKDKFNELKDKVIELAKEHGAKLVEKALALRDKVSAVLKELFNKIGQKEMTALYAAEQEEETFLESLNRRIRERLQKFLIDLKEKVSKVHGDIVDKVLPKIEEIRQKIADLAKQSGEKLIETAAKIRERIMEIFEELKGKITGETALYSEDEEIEEVDEEEEDPSILKRIVKRFQDRLQRSLERVKALIAKNKEIAEEFKEKVQEVAQKIADLAKERGRKLIDGARAIGRKISALFKDVVSKLGIGYAYQFDIKTAIKTLRDFFLTDEGVAALKDNAEKANPASSTGILIKAYLLSADHAAIKELISEMFKGINFAPIGQYQDIRELVKQASQYLQTAEGIAAVRAYAAALQTTHPVVLRLKEMLSAANDDAIRAVMHDIFTVN